MIRKQHRKHHQCLKFAFIEACFDSRGFYRNKDMAQMFGNHEKDAARVLKAYRGLNPDSTITESRIVWPSETYRRKVLKPSTNARAYLDILQQLLGSERLRND